MGSSASGLRDWPADEVTRWPIDAVQPYPRNPRTHSDAQIRLLAQSIEQYGFTAPLLVDEDGVIIAGHGRHLAAQLLGLDEVPVAIARGWTDAEKSAARITDNQLNLLSGWNMPMLKAELHDLSIDGSVELNTLGFPELQLGKFGFATKPPSDPEATPEPPAEPITKRGDLWELGEHLLLCGDATSADDVGRLGGPAVMTFTDPPYGVGYQDQGGSANTRKPKGKSKHGAMKNDDLSGDALLHFLISTITLAPLQENAAQYICHPSHHAHIFRQALTTTGFKVRSQLVWVKSRAAFNLEHYRYQHEPIYYAVRGTAPWYGDHSQTTVWTVASEGSPDHPTQKPVALATKAIINSSKHGDAVYEPFGGSGTTIIACEMTERRCLALEIEPKYVDVAVARWEQFTGKKAQKRLPAEAGSPSLKPRRNSESPPPSFSRS